MVDTYSDCMLSIVNACMEYFSGYDPKDAGVNLYGWRIAGWILQGIPQARK